MVSLESETSLVTTAIMNSWSGKGFKKMRERRKLIFFPFGKEKNQMPFVSQKVSKDLTYRMELICTNYEYIIQLNVTKLQQNRVTCWTGLCGKGVRSRSKPAT